MAERSVSIALEAKVTGFVAGMRTAQRSVTGFTSELEKSSKKKQALTDLGNTAGKVGFAAAAGLGAAVLASANFDQAMSAVQAATHESAGSMEALRAAALKAGADTVFSASEAADGIEQLAKAGVSTKDILGGGLTGALDLAAAGNVAVGDAAEYAATAMSQFGLKGDAVPHVADLLSAAAGKAQGEVSDFGMALKQGGLVADQTGLSIEETTGALAAFASKGLIGSDAGTSFKSMLQSLTPSTTKAKEAVDELGISAYDSQGNFIGLEAWAGKLRKGLSGMSEEQRNATMKTIFGSDAVRAASVIYDEGAKGIADWTNKVNDQGYAAETAATRLDNLKGDVEALKGSLETALIGTGDGAQGPLRSLTQSVTDAVNAYNGLPGAAKSAVGSLMGVTAVLGGGAFLGVKVVQGIASTQEALKTLGMTSQATAGSLRAVGAAGLAIGGAAIAASVIDSWDDANLSAKQLDASMQHLADGQVDDSMNNLSKSAGDLGDALSQAAFNDLHMFDAKDEVDQLAQSLSDLADTDPDAAAAAFETITKSAKEAGLSTEDLNKLFPDYVAGVESSEQAAREAADAYNTNARVLSRQSHAMEDNEQATKAAKDALLEYVDAQNAAADAAVKNKRDELALKQTMVDARKEAAKGKKTLDENTKAGKDNWNALLDVADQWNNTERKVQNAKGAYKDMRKEFINIAEQMGANEKQAKRWADQFLDVPPKVAKANNAVRDFAADTKRALANIDDEPVNVYLSAKAAKVQDQLVRSGMWNLASGGPVFGPGTETSDDIPARLSNNEHVLTAKEVKAFGGHKNVILWRNAALHGALPDPQDLPRFAEGGPVLGLNVKERGLGTAVSTVTARYDAMAQELSQRFSAAAVKALESMGGVTQGQLFAKAQEGKPYVWGGVGPNGYDCSGYQSAILNATRGRYPYSRVGTTGSSPWAGSQPGSGQYTIGYFKGSPGHMSGNIGGLNVESTGDHVRTGSAARSPNDGMFTGRFHYDRGGSLPPGTHLIHNGTGKPEMIRTDRQERALEQKLEQIRVEIRKQTGWLPTRAARSGRADQGGGGPTIVKIYDVDGQLMGSMRGEIDADRGYHGTLARQGVA